MSSLYIFVLLCMAIVFAMLAVGRTDLALIALGAEAVALGLQIWDARTNR